AIRRRVMEKISVTVSAPAQVGLFLYDNGTFIVESFLTHTTPVKITVRGVKGELVNIENNTVLKGVIDGEDSVFTIDLDASTFRAFRVKGDR
ncbi:MAG TPA: hypothetical protein VF857_01255, partial [Spirochaetota bacterium]